MRYVVALSVVCVTVGSGCMAKSPAENTREHMIAGMSTLLKSWDKDGDGKLSRAEVEAMTDETFRTMARATSGGKMTVDLEKQRQDFFGFYASQDTDRDGYLTLQELLKQPFAKFDCMDANHDGKVSREEMFNGMDKCPSMNLDDYAPKP